MSIEGVNFATTQITRNSLKMPNKQSFFVYDMKPVKDEKPSTSKATTSETTSNDDPAADSSSGRRSSIRDPAAATATGSLAINEPSATIGTSEPTNPMSAVPLRNTDDHENIDLKPRPSLTPLPVRIDSTTNREITTASGPMANVPTYPTAIPPENIDRQSNNDLISGPSITPLPLLRTDSPTNITVLPNVIPSSSTDDPSRNTSPPINTSPATLADLPNTDADRSATNPTTNINPSTNIGLSRSTVPSQNSSTSRSMGSVRYYGISRIGAENERNATTYPSYAVSTRGDTRPGSSYMGHSNENTSTVQYQLDNSSPYDRSSRDGRRSPTPSMYTLEREVRQYIHKRESSAYQFYPGAERLEYNYIEERTDLNNTNLIESTAHLIKGSLGAGVLSMHEAYMYGGLWTSLAVTFVIGVLVSYAMIILIKSAQAMYGRLRISKLSYPDLAEAAAATSPWRKVRKFSKTFRYLVDVCLFSAMCGTCCIYQIMIAHTFKQVFEAFVEDAWLIDVRLYILMSTPALLVLCLIRSLKFLAPFAMLADMFIGLCVMTTLYYSLRTVKVGIMERPGWKSVHGFMRILAICMYCTSGISVALPVENNMRRPRQFRQAIQYAMTVVIILTSLTGFFGYWGWGEECRSPITVHMPLNTFTTILQFLLLMMLSTTFAVQFWVPFRIIWHYLMRRHKKRPALWERFYRILMALVVTGVSLVFPNLIPVMIFLGQFLLGFIGIVFPAIIETLVFWEDTHLHKSRWWVLKNFALIVLGLFLSSSSYYSMKSQQ